MYQFSHHLLKFPVQKILRKSSTVPEIWNLSDEYFSYQNNAGFRNSAINYYHTFEVF